MINSDMGIDFQPCNHTFKLSMSTSDDDVDMLSVWQWSSRTKRSTM